MMKNIEFKSCTKLTENLWAFHGRFVSKGVDKNNNTYWFVHNKYNNGNLKDFCFRTTKLTTLMFLLNELNETIETPLLPELAKDFEETIATSE